MSVFRHVILMRFNEGAAKTDIEDMIEALQTLPSVIPEIVEYKLGRDLGVNQGNFDFAIVADFAGLDEYLVYRDHPQHRTVVTDKVLPLVAERAAIQYVL